MRHIAFNEVLPLLMPMEYRDVLSTEDCAQIIRFFEDNVALQEQGGITTAENLNHRVGGYDSDVRSVKAVTLYPMQIEDNGSMNSIFEKLGQIIERANFDFAFDLTELETLQILKYEEGDHHKWHMDANTTSQKICRKLSFTITLNDPSEFEGGAITFNLKEDENAKALGRPPLGTAVAFPSYLQHQVPEVTRGTRYSIVGWMLGPRFK